jgi:hypothetical protein
MTPPYRGWLIRAIAIMFAAVPFGFAAVRALRTGYDFRYFWLALASLLGASAVVWAGKMDARMPNSPAALTIGVFAAATSLAMLTAWLLSTTLGPGSLIVASAFGFCYAAGCVVYLLARR